MEMLAYRVKVKVTARQPLVLPLPADVPERDAEVISLRPKPDLRLGSFSPPHEFDAWLEPPPGPCGSEKSSAGFEMKDCPATEPVGKGCSSGEKIYPAHAEGFRYRSLAPREESSYPFPTTPA